MDESRLKEENDESDKWNDWEKKREQNNDVIAEVNEAHEMLGHVREGGEF